MSNNYVPEKIRAAFKKSHALRALHMTDEADKERRKCFRVYCELVAKKIVALGKEVVPKERPEDLVDKDFDDLVAFWSK